MVMPNPDAGDRLRPLPGMPAPTGAGGRRTLSMRAFARLITAGADGSQGHVPAPAQFQGALLYAHFREEGHRWRMLAGAPWGLASALGEVMGIDVDAAWHEELPASRRPHVVRTSRSDFCGDEGGGCLLRVRIARPSAGRGYRGMVQAGVRRANDRWRTHHAHHGW